MESQSKGTLSYHHCEQSDVNVSGDPLGSHVECTSEMSALGTNIYLLTAIPQWSRIFPWGLTAFRFVCPLRMQTAGKQWVSSLAQLR